MKFIKVSISVLTHQTDKWHPCPCCIPAYVELTIFLHVRHLHFHLLVVFLFDCKGFKPAFSMAASATLGSNFCAIRLEYFEGDIRTTYVTGFNQGPVAQLVRAND